MDGGIVRRQGRPCLPVSICYLDIMTSFILKALQSKLDVNKSIRPQFSNPPKLIYKREHAVWLQQVMRKIVKRFVIMAQAEKARDEVNEGRNSLRSGYIFWR